MPLSQNNALPAGSVQQFAGATIPAGWLECGGQAVSRTSFAALFLAIGTLYGAGDGSTTFNLPDMRGRVGVGRDDMGGTAANRVTSGNSGLNGATLGAAGGGEVVTITENQLPAHDHQQKISQAQPATAVSAGLTTGQTLGFAGQTGSGNGVQTALNTVTKGGGGAVSVIGPSIIINWIIKT